jgi:hypothetical protein
MFPANPGSTVKYDRRIRTELKFDGKLSIRHDACDVNDCYDLWYTMATLKSTAMGTATDIDTGITVAARSEPDLRP